MAKKTTRQRKELSRQRAVQQAAANVTAGIVQPASPAPSMSDAEGSTPTLAPAVRTGVDPSAALRAGVGEEYAYVRSDLRRIAILAAAIVALLVVLSLVIA